VPQPLLLQEEVGELKRHLEQQSPLTRSYMPMLHAGAGLHGSDKRATCINWAQGVFFTGITSLHVFLNSMRLEFRCGFK
jgi:hypothetical protein